MTSEKKNENQTLWPKVDHFHTNRWNTTSLGDKRGPGGFMDGPREYAKDACRYYINLPEKTFVREILAPPFKVKKLTLYLEDTQLDKIVASLNEVTCTPAKYSGVEWADDFGSHTFMVQVQMVKYGLASSEKSVHDLPDSSRLCLVFSDDKETHTGNPNPKYPNFHFPKTMTHDKFKTFMEGLFNKFEDVAPSKQEDIAKDF